MNHQLSEKLYCDEVTLFINHLLFFKMFFQMIKVSEIKKQQNCIV